MARKAPATQPDIIQKRARRYFFIELSLELLLLLSLAFWYFQPLALVPADSTQEVAFFSLLEQSDFDSIMLEHPYDHSQRTATGPDMTPILDHLRTISVRVPLTGHLPFAVDRAGRTQLLLEGGETRVQLDIYLDEYIELAWYPDNDRLKFDCYRLAEGALDYDTLAALFPQESGQAERSQGR